MAASLRPSLEAVARRAAGTSLVPVAYLVITGVMTYPAVWHFTSTDWVIHPHPDVLVKLWGAWYLGRLLAPGNGSSFWSTDLVFFPGPTSIVLHNFNLLHMAGVSSLTPLLGQVGAFNLVGVGAVLANSTAAFLLLRRLVAAASAAFVGGLIFGFSQWSLTEYAHPEQQFVFVIPLGVLVWLRALELPSLARGLAAAL